MPGKNDDRYTEQVIEALAERGWAADTATRLARQEAKYLRDVHAQGETPDQAAAGIPISL